MPNIKELINSLKSMELPKGAESLLSSIGAEANALESDRDDLFGKVQTRQTENGELKTRAQNAEAEVATLKEKLPADGSVTLSKADGERWQAYTALGKVDEVRTTLERVATLETEKAQADREATIRSAGYDPKKLGRLIGNSTLKVEGEGDALKVSVTVDDTDTALDEWAEAEGISDLVNVARLDPNARPAAMAQAGKRSPAPGKTEEQRKAEIRREVSI